MKKVSFLLVKDPVYDFATEKGTISNDGFKFKPKNHISYSGVTVSKMVMINPSFIEKVLKRKIEKRLELYLRFIVSILNSDDDTDPTDLRAALNDLTRYKTIVKNKYLDYLDQKYALLLMKKMELLENELKSRIISCITREEKNMEEEYHRSR